MGGSASRKCSLKEAGDGVGDSLGGGGLKEEELGEGQGREDILGRRKTSVHCTQRAWHRQWLGAAVLRLGPVQGRLGQAAMALGATLELAHWGALSGRGFTPEAVLGRQLWHPWGRWAHYRCGERGARITASETPWGRWKRQG